MNNPNCVFCDPEEMEWRTIRLDDYSRSFVSNPRFREGQCLVIPNRHVLELSELKPEEAKSILHELGRLGALLSELYGGYGSGVMQKYQPTQAENGIKVSHLHMHVFPRFEEEQALFPVPYPNTFDGFSEIPQAEVSQMAEKLR